MLHAVPHLVFAEAFGEKELAMATRGKQREEWEFYLGCQQDAKLGQRWRSHPMLHHSACFTTVHDASQCMLPHTACCLTSHAASHHMLHHVACCIALHAACHDMVITGA